MEIPILYEDGFMLVLDKPAGMVVNQAAHVEGKTVQQIMANRLGLYTTDVPDDAFANRAGIVHRLDKDTSGILLVAKNRDTFETLQNQFLERSVTKEYNALVHGTVSPSEGEIRAPVGRLPWNRMRFGVIPQGRGATTTYSSQKHIKYMDQSFTLLRVVPHTGRTHQIRVHCAWIGHTIVSDPLYAGRKVLRVDLTFCPRMFLHACDITFTHPNTGMSMTVNSPLPKDLENVLNSLKGASYV